MSNYMIFSGPARLQKTLNSLKGIIKGIGLDGKVSEEEVSRLKTWLEINTEFRNKHPFTELFPVLSKILSDGVISEEELTDLTWLVDKLTADTTFYDVGTSAIQELHGLMMGILADGKISTEEIDGLSRWIDAHTQYRTLWPYDEIESVVTSVLTDKVVDETEQQKLKELFQEFTTWPHRKVLSPETLPLSGICALTPEIVFPEKVFCLTGESSRKPRAEIAKTISDKGGKYWDNLTLKTDYLVVGAAGNPCWAYSCYGRKIEAAVKNRVKGAKTLIIHENDFWDSVMG